MALFNRWITGIRLLEIPTEPFGILFKLLTNSYMELWYTTWFYSSNKLRNMHEFRTIGEYPVMVSTICILLITKK